MGLRLKKIGIFGGTFNPIHNGHLSVAREVGKGFAMEKIWLVPASVPPHKQMKNVAEAQDRLEMIRLAVEGDPLFSVTDVELRREGPSYTIDTLGHLRSILPGDARPYFMMGMDAFLDIQTWKSYRELFRVAPFIVMSRPGSTDSKRGDAWKPAREVLTSKVSSEYAYDPDRNAFFHPEKKPVFLFGVAPVDISSTAIRRRIKQGLEINGLVPEKVKEFIKAKGLYT
jgi:nicotinate-nucleotide adenylyltransferase